jgi:nucleotide-binding universal stress UspA family protein
MKVLLATDGSSPAREGESLVASLFNPSGADVHAFSVKATSLQPGSFPNRALELELVDQLPANPEEVVEEAVERLTGGGFDVTSGTARGNPANEILRELDSGRYDMVVLGASHTTWMGNLLLGSVSTQVLHHAPCSVVIAHRAPSKGAPNKVAKILVGVDGSESSSDALDTAMKLLDPWRCAFTVATAVHLPLATVPVYPAGPAFSGNSISENQEKRLMDRAWHLVNRGRWRLEGGGFIVESAVLLGRAGPQLLKEADNIGADLAVVGSRGLGPVRSTLLGSVSDQVVRHASATLVGRMP